MSETHGSTTAGKLAVTAAVTLVLGLAAMCATSAAADGLADLRSHPGFVALEDLNLFGPDGPTTDVDLHGPMMKLVASATASSDPELSAALAGILRIRVLASEDVGDEQAVRSAIAGAGEQLEAAGWTRMARVADGDEMVLVLVREAGEHFSGMTVLVADGDEASLVNLVGDIDPATIGRLAAHLDALPDLDDLADLGRDAGR